VVLVVAASAFVGLVATRPGNESFAAKAADLLRDNYFDGVVNWAEARYYEYQAPPKGGVPDRAIVAPPAEVSAVDYREVAPPTTVRVRPHSIPPATILPVVVSPIAGEGVWEPVGSLVDGFAAMRIAQVRPDAEHTSVLAGVVWMDPRLVRFSVVPGAVEPGGRWESPPRVVDDQRVTLIAAFNGGFRMKEARGGFFHDGRDARPLLDGAASFVVHADGTADVAQWGRDAVLDPTVRSVRQNLALIVDGAVAVEGLDRNDRSRWGATLGNKVLVWRSGVGVRPDGTIVYAASNGLSIVTLADLFVRAGCVRAMELDINPEWVTFNLFAHPDPADPGRIDATKLLPDMQRPAERYLGDESRDFVTVNLR
jgi:hypothetical protein